MTKDVRAGQIWRGEDGYLYRILTEDFSNEGYVWARHPNAGPHAPLYQINVAWFDQPGWHMTSEAA